MQSKKIEERIVTQQIEKPAKDFPGKPLTNLKHYVIMLSSRI